MSTRLSININDATADVLHEGRENGRTATDQVHRAVSLYDFLHSAQRGGKRIQVVDANGDCIEVTIL